MKKIMYIIPCCFVLAACEPTLVAEFEDKPVVSCYLDAGASPELTVGKLIAFRDDAAYSDQDVDALAITITDETEGEVFQMQAAGEGKYECPQLTIEAEHTYRLDFTYDGKPVSAVTTVPEAPQDVKFSATSIGVMVLEQSSASRADAREIEITWSNDGRNYYIVEGYTASTTPVRELEEGETAPDKCFKLDYTQGNTATLSQMQFNYLYDYHVSLIRILPEYAVMSQGGSDTSTSLVDARGNIDGGYGIFTGINRVTKTVNVYKTTSPF